ncbi:unnamed protein product, partial [Mesorhabditis spiculigera]
MTDPSTSTAIPENPHKNENVVLFIILICSILLMPVIYLCYKLYLVWKAKKEKIKRILKQNERLKALHSKAISIKLLTGQKIGSSLSVSRLQAHSIRLPQCRLESPWLRRPHFRVKSKVCGIQRIQYFHKEAVAAVQELDVGQSSSTSSKKSNGDIGIRLRVPQDDELPRLPQNGILRNHSKQHHPTMDQEEDQVVEAPAEDEKESTPMLTAHTNGILGNGNAGRRSRKFDGNGVGNGRRSPYYWNSHETSRPPSRALASPVLPQTNGHANGHANYGDGAQKQSVQTYDFEDEPMPSDSCCCGKVHIMKGCRAVAILSLLSVIANGILYVFGFTRFGVSTWIEILILIFELFTIFMLFCGLSRKRSGFLKPYLFFNTIWAVCLCILFLMCVWQLIRGGNMPANLWKNLKHMKGQSEFDRAKESFRKSDDNTIIIGIVTALAMTGLASLIVVDFIFVQIVYRTFHYLAYKEDKAKEQGGQVISHNF